MWGIIIPSGVLCIVAIICAAHVPREQRGAAVSCALIVAFNWVLYVLPWSWQLIGVNLAPSTAINSALGREGLVKLSDMEVWAISDTMTAGLMLALAAHHLAALPGTDKNIRWGVVLWALFTVQIGLHVLYTSGLVAYAIYEHGLNGLFLAVISVFILIGGKGAKENAANWIAGNIPVFGFHGMGNAIRRTGQEEIDHGS